jgi:hypothetical protein
LTPYKNKLVSLLLITGMLGCLSYYCSDWLGWFLFGASFYMISQAKLDSKIKKTLLIILFVHQITALYYFFVYPGYVAGKDFAAFNLTAKTIAEVHFFSFGTDAALFSNLLALVYKLCNSQLVGQEISVVIFMASCFVFMRLIKYYKLENYSVPILLFYALSPAALLWTSVILREPFEITLLMIAFECILYFKSTGASLKTRFFYLGCALLLISSLGVIHKGLFFCLPIFLFGVLILPVKDKDNGQLTLSLVNTKTLSLYLFYSLLPYFLILLMVITQPSANREKLEQAFHELQLKNFVIYTNNNMIINMTQDMIAKKGLYKTFANYRYGRPNSPEFRSLMNSNTIYDKEYFVAQNLLQFTYMAIVEFLNYAFLPAVLVVGKWTLMNLFFSFIYLTRLLLFCSALIFSINLFKQKVRTPILLILLYLITSAIFSLGTITYGTALRHNLTTDWIVILLGGPLLFEFFKRVCQQVKFKICTPKIQRYGGSY